MTREQALEWALKYMSRNARKSHPDHKEFMRRTEYMVNKIYNDFETDVDKTIAEAEDSGWYESDDKNTCIELLYQLKDKV